MKNLILTLIFLYTILPTTASAYQSQSQIFNFTTTKIYFLDLCSRKKYRVAAFDSKTITYAKKNCQIFVNNKSNMIKPQCKTELNDKKDLFVTGLKGTLECTLRAERIPKEF